MSRVRFCRFRGVRPAPPVRGVCVKFAGLSLRPERAGAARRNRAFYSCFRALFARHVDAARLSKRCTSFARKGERLTRCNILRVSVSGGIVEPPAPPAPPTPTNLNSAGFRGRWSWRGKPLRIRVPYIVCVYRRAPARNTNLPFQRSPEFVRTILYGLSRAVPVSHRAPFRACHGARLIRACLGFSVIPSRQMVA